jgi:hypothetical protein
MYLAAWDSAAGPKVLVRWLSPNVLISTPRVPGKRASVAARGNPLVVGATPGRAGLLSLLLRALVMSLLPRMLLLRLRLSPGFTGVSPDVPSCVPSCVLSCVLSPGACVLPPDVPPGDIPPTRPAGPGMCVPPVSLPSGPSGPSGARWELTEVPTDERRERVGEKPRYDAWGGGFNEFGSYGSQSRPMRGAIGSWGGGR